MSTYSSAPRLDGSPYKKIDWEARFPQSIKIAWYDSQAKIKQLSRLFFGMSIVSFGVTAYKYNYMVGTAFAVIKSVRIWSIITLSTAAVGIFLRIKKQYWKDPSYAISRGKAAEEFILKGKVPYPTVTRLYKALFDRNILR